MEENKQEEDGFVLCVENARPVNHSMSDFSHLIDMIIWKLKKKIQTIIDDEISNNNNNFWFEDLD